MAAKKLPYFPFYPGDWPKDDALTLCAPATRGVWIDLLARMHECNRSGELRGTAEQLARAARCSTVELESAATDLKTTGTAEVVHRNGVYVIRNRRMYSEAAAKQQGKTRQKRFRDAKRNAQITPLYEDEYEIEFEEFWKAFPVGRKHSKAKAREAFAKAVCKANATEIIAAAREYAVSDIGRGAFVKMPTTWLNQECWLDDREAWKAKDPHAPLAPRQFEKVTPAEFKALIDAGKFQSRATKDANKPGRWFGTLKDGRKVECFTPPKTE